MDSLNKTVIFQGNNHSTTIKMTEFNSRTMKMMKVVEDNESVHPGCDNVNIILDQRIETANICDSIAKSSNLLILNIPEVTNNLLCSDTTDDNILPSVAIDLEKQNDCDISQEIVFDFDGANTLHKIFQDNLVDFCDHSDANIVPNEMGPEHQANYLDSEIYERYDVENNVKEDSDSRKQEFDDRNTRTESDANEDGGNKNIGEEIKVNEDETEDATIGTDDIHDSGPRRRQKRHFVNEASWKQNMNKLRREKGEEYFGKRKTDDVWKYDIKRKSRRIKDRCNCKLSSLKCAKENKLQCSKLSEDDRMQIFSKFWNDLNWSQRKTFINLSIENNETKRHRNRTSPIKSKRSFSSVYYLKKNEEKLRVCKRMFLNTLDIGERMVDKYSEKRSKHGKESTEDEIKHNGSGVYNERKLKLKEFFEKIPKLELHYCRSSSNKLYLEPSWESKSDIYKQYKNSWCKDSKTRPLSIATFNHMFEEMNLSLFKSKKDECDYCVSFRSGNLSEDVYTLHQEKKIEAREEKERDKLSNNKNIFCMDMEAVLLSPKSNVSSLYFKTKLVVHNFTIFNMKTKDGYCFIWHEVAGGVSANDYASILCTFIKEYVINQLEYDENIIFWSDGCTSQNRNATLSNALINMASHYNITIEQKYLEKGHTQMEADAMHSAIERKYRNVNINVPADYVGICLRAREKPRPYHVNYLDFKFFKDFSQLKFLSSIRPGKRSGDPLVTDIRAMKYLPDGSVNYKLRHRDNYQLLDSRRSCTNKTNAQPLENLPNLYKSAIPIKKTKYDHLQSLKTSIQSDYHEFYDNLPYKTD